MILLYVLNCLGFLIAQTLYSFERVSREIKFERNPDWIMNPENWSYIYEMSDFDMACMLIRLRLIANDEFQLAVLKVKLRLFGEDDPQKELTLFMNDLSRELASRGLSPDRSAGSL